MHSALYYPHSSLRNRHWLRNSLLLWDELHIIVPWEHFSPEHDPVTAEAWELFGHQLVPSNEQKRQAHELVLDFATRPLPRHFYFDATRHRDIEYQIYPQKFLPETWDALKEIGLVGDPAWNEHMPLEEVGALCVMAKLADACAGRRFARVTDRTEAYSVLAGQLVDVEPLETSSQEAVVQLSLDILNMDDVSLRDAIDFRRREEIEARGSQLRTLRHSYSSHVSDCLRSLRAAESEEHARDIKRDFQTRAADDVTMLRTELRSNFTEACTTTVLVSAIVGAGSWLATTVLGAPIPPIQDIPVAGAIVPLTGAFAARNKYARQRRAILDEHPMAYVQQIEASRRFLQR